MTPAEFNQNRRALGLTVFETAQIMGTIPDTIRKYETESADAKRARMPNPIACRVMEWMLAGWRPPEWPFRLR